MDDGDPRAPASNPGSGGSSPNIHFQSCSRQPTARICRAGEPARTTISTRPSEAFGEGYSEQPTEGRRTGRRGRFGWNDRRKRRSRTGTKEGREQRDCGLLYVHFIGRLVWIGGWLTNSSVLSVSLPPSVGTARPDDNSILPIPNHVVLNHLTASAIRNGTLAVGTTTRYKRKVSRLPNTEKKYIATDEAYLCGPNETVHQHVVV